MREILVVGSGIAGLFAALRASRRHRVTLVTKGPLLDGCTRYAQGGIAAALFHDDSIDLHIADTLRAGAGLCDTDAVAALCAEGPDRVLELLDLGVQFDREAGELARGHEAAHSMRRVLHAGGDRTGLAIQTALVEQVRGAGIRVIEHAFLDDILLEHGRVAGIRMLTPTGEATLLADTVVLATGGAGQLYRHTTNPPCATGDGVAAAWRAGARLRDLEFTQFHPTALAVPGSPLISEAVRGEGAWLLDSQARRFMLDAHPDAELAPRDVVARAIASAMAEQGGGPAWLDARHLGGDHLSARFPALTAMLAGNGFDWGREPVPVVPAAHYSMGGVATDNRGRTSIPGMYAVGEVACTGVHGANRLASNSLLEGLVFAARAAEDLMASREDWPVGSPAINDETVTSRGTEPATREEIQDVMWKRVGLYRQEEGLESARAQFAGWRVAGDDVASRETANLLLLAKLTTASALARRESRGAHFREDAENHVAVGEPLALKPELAEVFA